MSAQGFAIAWIALYVESLLLATLDDQPKPRYTACYVYRVILGFASLGCIIGLVVNAL
jgi:hypothetical protein